MREHMSTHQYFDVSDHRFITVLLKPAVGRFGDVQDGQYKIAASCVDDDVFYEVAAIPNTELVKNPSLGLLFFQPVFEKWIRLSYHGTGSPKWKTMGGNHEWQGSKKLVAQIP